MKNHSCVTQICITIVAKCILVVVVKDVIIQMSYCHSIFVLKLDCIVINLTFSYAVEMNLHTQVCLRNKKNLQKRKEIIIAGRQTTQLERYNGLNFVLRARRCTSRISYQKRILWRWSFFHVIRVGVPSQSAPRKHNRQNKAHTPLRTSWNSQSNVSAMFYNHKILLWWL